jgi:hypothetical protein
MAFLSICGYDIPIKDGQADDSFESEGADTRALSGKWISMRRYTKREFRLRTTIRPKLEAAAIMHLLNGEGHYWNFNDAVWQYSSKGLNITSGTATQGAGGQFNGKIRITTPTVVVWPALAPAADQWTVMLWQKLAAAGTYTHVVVRDDGAKWIDGVRNDAASTLYITVAPGGDVTIGDGTDTRDFDDLVIVSWRVSDAMPPAFYASGVPFGSTGTLPSLRVRGELLEPHVAVMDCYAVDIKSDVIQAMDDGTWDPAGREVSFRLVEE